MKIFVTLGSQKFQFNRLLQALDDLMEQQTGSDSVFAQTGYSDYQPKHYPFRQFLDREEYAAEMGRADIVITHGGTGAIIGAVSTARANQSGCSISANAPTAPPIECAYRQSVPPCILGRTTFSMNSSRSCR